jgi:hypothetical protein
MTPTNQGLTSHSSLDCQEESHSGATAPLPALLLPLFPPALNLLFGKCAVGLLSSATPASGIAQQEVSAKLSRLLLLLLLAVLLRSVRLMLPSAAMSCDQSQLGCPPANGSIDTCIPHSVMSHRLPRASAERTRVCDTIDR